MCFLLHASFSLKKSPKLDVSTKMLENFTEKSSLCTGQLPGGGHRVLQDVGVTSSFINMGSKS